MISGIARNLKRGSENMHHAIQSEVMLIIMLMCISYMIFVTVLDSLPC